MRNFRLTLDMRCFVAFRSAELRIHGGESPQVRLSIGGIDYAYLGGLACESADRLHDLVVAALASHGNDPAWGQAGLDGTEYRGTFHSEAMPGRDFRFWSPRPGTAPHWLASAAISAVSLDHADEAFNYELREIRKDLGFGTA